jgi:hypothetical protein
VASGGTGNRTPPIRAKTRIGTNNGKPGAVTRSRVPTADDDERKSFTLDGYHFRKDGAGYECREVIGKGKARKRPYLSYLSRAYLSQMQREAKSAESLEERIKTWADQKKAKKRSG